MDKLLCPVCNRRLLDASIKLKRNFKFKGVIGDNEEALQIKCSQCKKIITLARVTKD